MIKHTGIVVLSWPSLRRTAIARLAGQADILDKEQMGALGYPNPRGHYFCLPLEFLTDELWASMISTELVEEIRDVMTNEKGAPVALSWFDLVTRL